MSVRVYGRCPSARQPMASGDGLVVRLRPPNNRLTPDQARAIAAAAQDYGNGLIDLPARANLQLRGVRAQTHAALIAALSPLGLVEPEGSRAPRNIIVTPFADAQTYALADALQRALRTAPDLPHKFGFVIDCGPAPVMGDISGDIRLERSPDGRLLLRATGLALGAPVTKEQAPQAMCDLARWFVDAGGMHEGRGRMAQLIAQGACPKGALAPTDSPAPGLARPLPGVVAQGALVGFEFGQLQGETLAQLATLGPLRLTPWRMLLIEGLRALPDVPGLITDPRDPRLRIFACTGAPGCLQGQGDVRALARWLAPELAPDTTLHVSGCAKGCALPTPADLTLVATPEGVDLIVNGRAGDPPFRRALSPMDILQLPEFS
ncbi:precorrin-3B synthase [Thioclava indica]|uniref:Nitrite/Sulfite reductase ferredoxin-like domain-containing protein n=1 Tax=Thioclava indica TaxID=1353528 RepID=A0A074KGP4_9RHOB|nr:precorrin-3B synthase [Thioclava indica]KEO60717.1 hypothetical protein DT23_12815 [Thioclava indica]